MFKVKSNPVCPLNSSSNASAGIPVCDATWNKLIVKLSATVLSDISR